MSLILIFGGRNDDLMRGNSLSRTHKNAMTVWKRPIHWERTHLWRLNVQQERRCKETVWEIRRDLTVAHIISLFGPFLEPLKEWKRQDTLFMVIYASTELPWQHDTLVSREFKDVSVHEWLKRLSLPLWTTSQWNLAVVLMGSITSTVFSAVAVNFVVVLHVVIVFRIRLLFMCIIIPAVVIISIMDLVVVVTVSLSVVRIVVTAAPANIYIIWCISISRMSIPPLTIVLISSITIAVVVWSLIGVISSVIVRVVFVHIPALPRWPYS